VDIYLVDNEVDVHVNHTEAGQGLGYWLRVVLRPLATIRSPCWVTLMLWIDTPAGSFGMLMLKFVAEPRSESGIRQRR